MAAVPIAEEQMIAQGEAGVCSSVWQGSIALSTLVVGYYFDRLAGMHR
jgi:hypothetical protein